jgi:hypothetical protein
MSRGMSKQPGKADPRRQRHFPNTSEAVTNRAKRRAASYKPTYEDLASDCALKVRMMAGGGDVQGVSMNRKNASRVLKMSKQPRTKRAQYFEKVREYKQRFTDLPSDLLRKRLAQGSLFKEAAVAIREILEERSNKQQADSE